MLRLIGLVVSIGLADSLNPSTVGPALFLASGKRPRADVIRFTAGIFGVFALAGCVLTIGPGQALLALVPHPGPTVRYVAETVAGVAMLAGFVYLWRNRGPLGHRARSSEPRTRRGSAGWLGVTIAAVELPTAFPYFATIAAIIAAGLNPLQDLFLIGLYNLCFVLPLLGIVAVLEVAGDRAVDVLERIRSYLRAHWPVLLAAVALVAGVFVTVLGVTGLIGSTNGRVGHYSRRLHHLITHP
jgi:cytochrome c biogenesis protein CcdA